MQKKIPNRTEAEMSERRGLRHIQHEMDVTNRERYSLFLLLSLVTFMLLSAFAEVHRVLGDSVLLISMYVILLAATLALPRRGNWRWLGTILAGMSMLLMVVQFFRPVRGIVVGNSLMLAVFLGFVSVALFSYLQMPGSVTPGRLYTLVSLYLLLGLFYFAIFNLLETLHPRSFMQTGLLASSGVSRHSLLYLSLVTLTTLGYGDVVPVSALARLTAALEAVTGVLYIAITVARLVAAYSSTVDN
jgi:voltage-gated potassium channel Kch